ncbi:MAG TPA: response regulator transcription factor [Steroidobacteraceae bacterium]|nr:response regulator transcription factor [Steroidobacteraceae bacterium]
MLTQLSPGRPVRVLLADDNSTFRKSTAAWLKSAPWIELVAVVENGTECLQYTRALSPDVVVLDLAMPDFNGFEITQQLKALGSAPRVVILSLYDEQEYRRRARQVGAEAYVAKMQTVKELVPAIQATLTEIGEAV